MRILAVCTIATLALAVLATAAPAQTQEPLASHMGDLQRYAHKLGLALDAGNQPLAEFYRSKLEETMGVVEKKYATWESLQIGSLMKAMLGAPLAPVGDALDKGDLAAASTAFDALLTNGCNGCHTATQRQFIKIKRVKSNPFDQDFAK
jgi:hypothetical protein